MIKFFKIMAIWAVIIFAIFAVIFLTKVFSDLESCKNECFQKFASDNNFTTDDYKACERECWGSK